MRVAAFRLLKTPPPVGEIRLDSFVLRRQVPFKHEKAGYKVDRHPVAHISGQAM